MRDAWSWRKTAGRHPANGRVTFVSPVAAGVIAGLFILIVTGFGLGLLYTMSYRVHFQLLRDKLETLARIAASQMDGDLHSRISHPDHLSSFDYDRAIEPLIRVHNSDPDIYYVYTERYYGLVSYYILDTATRLNRLKVRWDLKPSTIMEPVAQNDPAEDAACLKANKNGESYVYAKTYKDPEYGTFLTASAPFRDSRGRFEGVVSIDYSTESLESAMKGLKRAFLIVMGVMCLISVCGGLFAGFITRTIDENARERRKYAEERIELERRIHHAQRLESLGLMAGGIAHDFNNILTVIIGNIDLARNRALRQLDAFSPLDEAKKASFRAAELTRQMLAFTGKDKIEPEPVMLNTLVHETVSFLSGSVSKMIAIDLKIDPGIPIINGDPTQLQQVIMNLVLNSAEAIGENEGKITLATGVRRCEEEPDERIGISDLSGRRMVFLEVSDTGCGMDEETVERIFDPFFSTKFLGRGLGMSAAMGIVKSHHGEITVRSASGRGTSVSVFLPIPEKTIEIETDRRHPGSDLSPGQFSGTVLLVDDEESVLKTAKSMLQHLGLVVLEAKDGIEAVSVFMEHADTISCVILDVTMPRMDGIKTFEVLSQHKTPDVKIFISSGYSEENVYRRIMSGKPAGFIQKPYELNKLCHVMRNTFVTQT